MKIVYLILVLLVFYFAFYFIRFEYILSHAHLAVIDQKDRTLGTGTPLKYIAAGDSTAVGAGASSAEKSYPYQIAQSLSSSHAVEYRNVAVIGAKTQDVIDKQLSQIVSYNPDIITISIGGNDVTHFRNNSKIIDNFKNILAQLTDKTHAKIYITDVPRFDYAFLLPWPFRQYYNAQANTLNVDLLKLDTDRVKFIDIHSVPAYNAPDQFHPNDKAYVYWFQAFISKINQ